MYFDRAGNKITHAQYRELDQDDNYRMVRNEYLKNGLYVSTIWMGMDHAMPLFPTPADYKPVIFETMVLDKAELVYQRRAHDEAGALIVHEDAVSEFEKRIH